MATGLLSLALAITVSAQTPADIPEVSSNSFFAASVADLDAAGAWYGRVLGLEPVRAATAADAGTRVLVMRRGGLVVELIEMQGSRPAEDMQPALRHRFQLQGLVKSGIFVADAAAWHAYLTAAEVETDEEVITDAALGMRTFVFRDPDGNRIQVFEPCSGDCNGEA